MMAVAVEVVYLIAIFNDFNERGTNGRTDPLIEMRERIFKKHDPISHANICDASMLRRS